MAGFNPKTSKKPRIWAKMKALIAISRKLLRIAFALARDDTVYDENYIKYFED